MFICQATINNTIRGVGTSVICGFYGCLERDALANIFIQIPNPLMDRSENDRRDQQFRLKPEQNKKIQN